MPKCRWLKGIMGRQVGDVEDKQDDLIEAWVKAGYVEKVKEIEKTTAEEQAEDLERRRKPVEAKSVAAPPVDKAMKSEIVKKK